MRLIALMKLACVGALLAAAGCTNRSAQPQPGLHQASPQNALPVSGRAAGATPNCSVVADIAAMQSSEPPAWLASEELQGPCDMDPQGRLLEDEESEPTTEVGATTNGSFTLTYRGPQGSGRYWEVDVSFRSDLGTLRGFCFTTSTVGWRHVGGQPRLAKRLHALLAWLQDLDGDGRQELVVPSSFPLSSDASLSDYGMTATAYDGIDDKFLLDEASTRTVRLKIAEAYREAGESAQVERDDRVHYTEAARELRKAACAP